MNKPISVQIRSKEIRDIVEWAIEPMESHFRYLKRERSIRRMPDIPFMDGNTLIIPRDKIAIEDFIYRIETQYPEMLEGEPNIEPDIRRAKTLAKKIKELM